MSAQAYTRHGSGPRIRVGVLCADSSTPLLAKWYKSFVSVVFDGSIEDFEPVYVTEDFKTDLAPGKRGLAAFAAAGKRDYALLVSEYCPGLPDTTPLIRDAIRARLAVGGTFVAKKLWSANFNTVVQFLVHSGEFVKDFDNGTISAYTRVARGTGFGAAPPERLES